MFINEAPGVDDVKKAEVLTESSCDCKSVRQGFHQGHQYVKICMNKKRWKCAFEIKSNLQKTEEKSIWNEHLTRGFNCISHLSTAFFSAFSQVCPPYRSRPLSQLGPVRLGLPFQRAAGEIHPEEKKYRLKNWLIQMWECEADLADVLFNAGLRACSNVSVFYKSLKYLMWSESEHQ